MNLEKMISLILKEFDDKFADDSYRKKPVGEVWFEDRIKEFLEKSLYEMYEVGKEEVLGNLFKELK